MGDEQTGTAAPVVPAAPAVPDREKLVAALNAERSARAKMVMGLIEALCNEHNCKFIAQPVLIEQPSGGFTISANPGVVPL